MLNILYNTKSPRAIPVSALHIGTENARLWLAAALRVAARSSKIRNRKQRRIYAARIGLKSGKQHRKNKSAGIPTFQKGDDYYECNIPDVKSEQYADGQPPAGSCNRTVRSGGLRLPNIEMQLLRTQRYAGRQRLVLLNCSRP